jgi:2-haloacid dehalogenase
MPIQTSRREFIQAVAVGTVAGAATEGQLTASQQGGALQALAFDAYGTLFDVFSVTALCEELFPGRGTALAQAWRAKQLQYSLLRSLMARHTNFWRLTEDGLVWAARSLQLELTASRRSQLLDAYLSLAAFPDVVPGLKTLKERGVRLAILSNGEPKMLRAAADSAGLTALLDAIISVEEVGIFKPSARVYALAEKHLGAGSRIGFVSSNSWDIAGAGSAGLTTFWIQRSAAEPSEELGFPATHVVRSLTELGSLI